MFGFKPIFILTLTFFLLLSCYGQKSPKTHFANNVETIDHSTWDNLLNKYVDEQGNIDYGSFKGDTKQLNNYIDFLAQNPISSTAQKEERLAYYINLYNAGTVQLILENYPLESIKNIFRPWGKDRLMIRDEKISLGEIEHDILRKMDEPRIHFAINCASFSCPKLLNEAFTASRMEEQLEKAASDFINDSSKNKISENNVSFSKIFKWYGGDFKNTSGLIDYINKYSKIKISVKPEIEFLNYDWRLNDKK